VAVYGRLSFRRSSSSSLPNRRHPPSLVFAQPLGAALTGRQRAFPLGQVIFRCCVGQRVNVVTVDPIGSGRRRRVWIPVRAADPINGWLPRHWINILAVDVEPWGAARGIVVHVCRHTCSPRLATRAATKHRESPLPEVLIHDQKSSTRMPQSATLLSSTDHSEGFRPSTRPSPTT